MKQFRINLLIALILLACSMDEGDSQIEAVGPDKLSWSVNVSDGKLGDSEGKLFVPYDFNSVHFLLDEA